jgi:hypothetical protein
MHAEVTPMTVATHLDEDPDPMAELIDALEWLSPLEQQALILIYQHGCTQRDTAQLLSVPLEVVASAVAHGMRILSWRLSGGPSAQPRRYKAELRTSISHRSPGARARRASPVTSITCIASARAT